MASMSVSGASSSKVLSLQELCARKVHGMISREVEEHFQEHPTLLASQRDSLSLTEAKMCELLRKRADLPAASLASEVPYPCLEMIGHPWLITEWQKQNGFKSDEWTERAWQVICEREKFPLSSKACEEISWEQVYYMYRFRQLMVQSYCNFTKIKPEDWAFFYQNRHRVAALNFNNDPLMKDGQLQEIAKLFPKATCWHLSHCCGLTEKGLKDLFRSHTAMEVLDLSLNGHQVNTAVVNALASSCKSLKKVNLFGIQYSVDPKALIAFARANSHLEELTMGSYRNVTNADLIKMLSYCKELKRLTIQDMPALDMETLEKILTMLPQLESLSIVNCKGLKAEEEEKISRHAPVKNLEVRGCPGLSGDKWRRIVERFINLQRFSWTPCGG